MVQYSTCYEESLLFVAYLKIIRRKGRNIYIFGYYKEKRSDTVYVLHNNTIIPSDDRTCLTELTVGV